MVDALCAQCERAKGRILCVDEGLKYCTTCSTELHRKAARRHHQLVVPQPTPTCDECEEAVARVECADCGGRGEPLLFCQECSRSLHSRVARSRHVLKPFPQLRPNDPREPGLEPGQHRESQDGTKTEGSAPHGSAKQERAEANLWKPFGDIMRNFRSPVKSEPLEGVDASTEKHEETLPCTEAEAKSAGQSSKGTKSTVPRVVKQELPVFKHGNGSVPKDHSLPHESHKDKNPGHGKQVTSRVVASGHSSTKVSNVNSDTERPSKNGAAHDHKPRKPAKRKDHDEDSSTIQNKRQKIISPQPNTLKFHGKQNESKKSAVFGAKPGAANLSGDKQHKDQHKKPTDGAMPDNLSKQNKAFWQPNPQEDNSDLSEEYFSMDDDGGSDTVSSGEEEEGGIHRIKRGSVSLEAFVVNADHEEDAEQSHSGEDQETKANSGVKDRIKKMLKLGLHPDTPEAEAQQALKNAQRLLTKHNLKQAEVMKGALKDPAALVGGMRVVELRGKGRTKVGRFERWIKSLAWVIADNFDAQHFTRKASKALQVVFYGIAQNADCAGYAFAATFNRITKMSAAYTDPDSNRDNAASKRSTNTRVARMSYRDGVVEGLRQFVKLSQEQRRAGYSSRNVKAEAADVSGGESDCSGRGNPCSSSNESETESFRNCQGGKSEAVKVEKDRAKLAWQQRAAEKRAERGMAICALVVHSQKVGEDFLKGQGIKLRMKSVKRKQNLVNVEAYSQGKEDSRQIDINQRGIASSGKRSSKKPNK